MSEFNVLVIGATSTIGGHVVDQLSVAGRVSTIAAVRNPQKAAPFVQRKIATRFLDLDDIQSVRQAVQGIDSVFLLTGYTVDMIIQSKIVVDQAVLAGVKHIVHMGAWAPADTDLGHFGWHQMIEKYIEASGLEWTHVAPGMFMQNMLGGGTLWGSFTNDGEPSSRAIHAFTGEGRLGWIAAEDVARICVAALHDRGDHLGKKYDLCVETRSVQEIAEILTSALETPFHAVTHDPEDFYQALLAGGMEPTYAACARETLIRFGRGGIAGQELIFPFEEIIGVAPISWKEFALLHASEFLRDR
jgi:uncharacterized protein YbjT (DUF2867 family)